MSEGKKCEEEEKKQMKNDRDEKLISITCCLLVDCYGIELREPLERGNRALIYIGHAEPLYSILMNESDQFQRAVRLIFTECTRFCVVIARFFFWIAHAFHVLRVGFAFVSWIWPSAYLIKI